MDSPLPLLTDLSEGGPALIVTWSWNFKAQSTLYLAGPLALHLTVGRREAERASGLGVGQHRLRSGLCGYPLLHCELCAFGLWL